MKKHFPILLAFLSTCIIASWVFYQFRKIQNHDTKIKISDRDYKNSIIKHALTIELPTTNTIFSEEANKISIQATQNVHDGNYEEAINIILSGLKKFPQDFTLQSDFASLLGDCSEVTPSPLKNKMIQRSKQLFERLMKEIDGQPKEASYILKNEYYYRFAKYREQYELGLCGVNEFGSRCFLGYYSQGVGAANYARKLLEIGNKQLALDYAQKALIAWAQYFTYKNDYYNPYVHYALALGILGYKEEMMRALRRSASIINQNLCYHEFKDVIDFIEKIEKK